MVNAMCSFRSILYTELVDSPTVLLIIVILGMNLCGDDIYIHAGPSLEHCVTLRCLLNLTSSRMFSDYATMINR